MCVAIGDAFDGRPVAVRTGYLLLPGRAHGVPDRGPGESVAVTLRCYVDSEAPADEAADRLRPLELGWWSQATTC
jgi:hypothetical protein